MTEQTAASTHFAVVGESDLGERLGDDTLRFVRRYAVAQERLWAALTTPEGIAPWLGRPLTIEPFLGGAFVIAFGDEDRMNGKIVECDPPRRLSIAWHETSTAASAPDGTLDGDTSLVTFDLAPDAGGGTLLVLTHRHIVDGETMIGFGGGWHTHLEALGAFVAGRPATDRDALYAIVKPLYERSLTGIANKS